MRRSGPALASAAAVGAWIAGASTARAVTYAIDPARSEVRFRIEAGRHHVIGRTHGVRGSAVLALGTLSGARTGEAVVDAASLNTGNGVRDRVLRGKLETNRYPELRFKATGFANEHPPAQQGDTWRTVLLGDLTIRGVTRPVALEMAGRWEGNALRAKGSTEFKLTDFGIEPPQFLGFLRVKDRVRVDFEVVVVPGPR
jgi:polyisoprenoid-binding protein YceI